MVFKDRIAKYPGRWTMVKSDGNSEIVTLVRNDEPTEEGTPINAETLNTLSDVAGADVARMKAEEAANLATNAQNSSMVSAANASKYASAAENSSKLATASQTAASSFCNEASESATAAKASEEAAKTYSESVKVLSLGLTIENGRLCVVYTPSR